MNNKAAGQKPRKPTKKADEPERKSFFETMPGLLTAIAALVTAIGGCIAVFVSNPRLLDLIIPSSPTPPPIANTVSPGQLDTQVAPVVVAEPTNTISPGLASTLPSLVTPLALPVELLDG